MIQIKEMDNIGPYKNLREFYSLATSKNQKNIEAICISSYNKEKQEISSRYVNIKYINQDKFFFFTNYSSDKAKDFSNHKQVAAVFFWNEINVQIRMRGKIFIADGSFSDKHFRERSSRKNALAISSKQSQKIKSYREVSQNYNKKLKEINECKTLPDRPDYWGGYFLKPYFFEFWEGDDNRINKRTCYQIEDQAWSKPFYLQP